MLNENTTFKSKYELGNIILFFIVVSKIISEINFSNC